jgi:hypothetical protein
MSKEELIKFLKENLKVKLNNDCDYLCLELKIENETIAYETINLGFLREEKSYF